MMLCPLSNFLWKWGTLMIITKLNTGTKKPGSRDDFLDFAGNDLIYITTIYGCAKFLTFSILLFHCFQNHRSVKVPLAAS